MEHKHAIIIIKNDKSDYLQYFDDRWDSFLFPNCKLSDDNYSKLIFDSLINKYQLPLKDVKVEYLMDKVHDKFSESAKQIKTYHHYFYEVHFAKLPSNMSSNKFILGDRQFAWFDVKDLENNKRIQQVNSDIVEFIKQLETKKP